MFYFIRQNTPEIYRIVTQHTKKRISLRFSADGFEIKAGGKFKIRDQ